MAQRRAAARKNTAKDVKQVAQRSAERALKEERLALAAIVKVFLDEVDDPMRPLARIEAMVRAAEAPGSKVPAQTRKMLLDGARFIRTAVERETGKPQQLLDPHIGHIRPSAVERLTGPEGPTDQLGLAVNGDVLGDAAVAQEERLRTISAVHEQIVVLLRRFGPLPADAMYLRYVEAPNAPSQSYKALGQRVRELATAGRLKYAAEDNRWRLIETPT